MAYLLNVINSEQIDDIDEAFLLLNSIDNLNHTIKKGLQEELAVWMHKCYDYITHHID